MSAQPTQNTAHDLINIEVDGQAMQVPKGSMIIQATDKAGISVPRFCYHDKLPIAANCRMCLVEVEKSPKPMPACATPVMEGMKIYTQSPKALSSQRNVMEFLLINHPLDCPICDQGGECELQDLSVGYGRSVSRFVERKRVVPDEDLGPLVSTEMTRCIQCTRCVRVMSEVAGTYELGGMERGENLQIGTYVGKPLMSELSGNVIDVCPVGALTNKVFRFKARAWELIARESIAYHDALGSNLWLHTRRGEVLRTVPRDNETINECWLSDRDRYSHQALNATDRAQKPMIRKGDALVETSWEEAIAFLADGLKRHTGSDLGAFVAPLTSCEEGYLLGEILRGLGSNNIDHRLRVTDFTDNAAGAAFELPLAEIEKAGAILLIGSNPRHEQPLLAHRLRKACKHGAKVFAINSVEFEFNFDLAGQCIAEPWRLIDEVAAVARAATDSLAVTETNMAETMANSVVEDRHRLIVEALKNASSAVIVFGDFAVQHPAASLLRGLARRLAKTLGIAFNELPSGANAMGLARAGVLPQGKGLDAAAMLAKPPKALLVYHAGSQDTSDPQAFDKARTEASFCAYIGAYACQGVRRTAHVVLPIGLPPEIDATFVNVDGQIQQIKAGAKLPADARAGWRVLRALGAALRLPGFDFNEITELRQRLMPKLANALAATSGVTARRGGGRFTRISTVPIYRSDAVVRRAAALQAHPLTQPPCVTLHPDETIALGLKQDELARVSHNGKSIELPVKISARVPRGAAWIESCHTRTSGLGAIGATLDIARA